MKAREDLIAEVVGNMPQDQRRFLLSFKRGEPDWKLLDLPGVEDLPTVRWRLQNLAKLDGRRRDRLLDRLREILGLSD